MDYPEDMNDYTLRRKKRGKYKSGPYADLNLPSVNRGEFKFALPDGKKDEVPEFIPKQLRYTVLKEQQNWLCAKCNVKIRLSDMSDWVGPIAEYRRVDGVIKAFCPSCNSNFNL